MEIIVFFLCPLWITGAGLVLAFVFSKIIELFSNNNNNNKNKTNGRTD